MVLRLAKEKGPRVNYQAVGSGSGTTKAFTNSMQAFSETWTLGTGKSVAWPVGVGGKGNAGVAGVIKNTPGAIGYVNQSYIDDVVRPAALQNKLGDFVLPSVDAGAVSYTHLTLPTICSV